jgi:hypothetical protein
MRTAVVSSWYRWAICPVELTVRNARGEVMEHGRFRNWLSHYPDAGLLIACKDGSGYQLCVDVDGEMQCLTDSEGARLTFGSLEQAEGFLRAHRVHQAKLRIYDSIQDENEDNCHEIIIKF